MATPSFWPFVGEDGALPDLPRANGYAPAGPRSAGTVALGMRDPALNGQLIMVS